MSEEIDKRIDEFEKKLTREYFLLKKMPVWFFLGGAVAIILVAFGITYKSFVDELAEKTAQETRERISELMEKAEQDYSRINTILTQSGFLSSEVVMAFNAEKCPSGWKSFDPGFGRFLRGIDLSDSGIDPDGKRAPGEKQEDSFQSHRHLHGSSEHPDGGMFNTDRTKLAGGDQRHAIGDFGILEPTGEEVRTTDETRPKNVAVLFCTNQPS